MSSGRAVRSQSQAETSTFLRDGFMGPVRLFTPAQCALIVESLRVGSHPPPMDWPKGRAANDRFYFDLATGPTLLGLLAPLLGKDIVLWSIDIVERDPGQIHPWHSDIESAAPGGRFVSVWIGIRNTSRESALQMIPGSHAFGKPLQQVAHEHKLGWGEATEEMVLAWARERDSLAAPVQPAMADGDAILFDGRLWHGSNNGRAEGRRVALLLQYAAADSPVSIPDYSGPMWPFRFKETRPPVLVVSGRGDDAINRLVPPPPAIPLACSRLTTFVGKIELLSPADSSTTARSKPLICGSTPALRYLEAHYLWLGAGQSPHGSHNHFAESLAIVLDGTLEALVDDDPGFATPRSIRATPNSIIYHPPYQFHQHGNCSDKPGTYLFFYWHSAPVEPGHPLTETVVETDLAAAQADRVPVRNELLFEHPTSCLTKLHARLTTLQPGAGCDARVYDDDVAIVLLSGSVETLGRTVDACSFIFCAAGQSFGIRNIGDEPAHYIVLEFQTQKRLLRNRPIFQISPPEPLVRQSAQDFRLFWAGPPLSVYEELCLTSLVARGQRVFLYSYDSSLCVPDGVELVDAHEVLPGDHIHTYTHADGETSPVLHADLFRYEVLRRFGGWYCDLDVVLVGNHPPVADIYIAREDAAHVNNSVLRFPQGAPLMVAAAEAARGLMTSESWGASGPALLTRLVEAQGLLQSVQPWTAAYPVRTTEVAKLFLPEHREELEDRAAGADFVHLWNQIWRRVRIPKEFGPPEGSFLDSMFRSFGIRVAPSGRMSARAVASWFHEFNVMADARRLAGGLSTIAELTQALEQARIQGTVERDQFLKSTSWRVTAPIRVVSQALRDLRGRS
jgi:hypothetical protein